MSREGLSGTGWTAYVTVISWLLREHRGCRNNNAADSTTLNLMYDTVVHGILVRRVWIFLLRCSVTALALIYISAKLAVMRIDLIPWDNQCRQISSSIKGQFHHCYSAAICPDEILWLISSPRANNLSLLLEPWPCSSPFLIQRLD